MWHLLYQKENEILSLSLWFLVQSTVEAVKLLYQIGFPCFKYKGVLALYFFQHLSLQVWNTVASLREMLPRWLRHHIPFRIVAVFGKSFLKTPLGHSNVFVVGAISAVFLIAFPVVDAVLGLTVDSWFYFVWITCDLAHNFCAVLQCKWADRTGFSTFFPAWGPSMCVSL